MKNQVNERLRLLIKSNSRTQKKFCETIDISEASLKSIFYNNHNPNAEVLIKIATSFPQCSINWLLTGKGEMLKDGQASAEVAPKPNESELIAYLKSQIKELKTENEDLRLKNERLSEQNGYYKGLLETNSIQYKQTGS